MKIQTAKQRDRLKPRQAPYWHTVSPRHAIGVRKYEHGFAWAARNGKIHTFPDSGHLDYQDALEMVINFWKQDEEQPSITVQDAITAYVRHLRVNRGISAEVSTRKRLERHCGSLMHIPVQDLTATMLRDWMNALPGQPSTVNRVRAMLLAALNLTDCDPDAWSKLKARDTGDTSRKLLLSSEQIKQLIDATSGEFRNLVTAASLTGARLGELRNLRGDDLAGSMLTLNGKTGERTIPLRDDAAAFFTDLIDGDALILPSPDGDAWKPNEHTNLFKKAVRDAGLPSESVFYNLRHTFISSAVRDGLPILAVAQYCGTSVAMIEQHYGKFKPNEMQSLINTVSL